MRQIGTLPRDVDPKALVDHLLTLGITTHVDERPEGWDVWVHNEDRVPQARDELGAYRDDPSNARYHVARNTAQALRRESEQLDRRYRKNVRDLGGTWDRPNLRRRPLTLALVSICVAVFLVLNLTPYGGWLIGKLTFGGLGMDARGHLRVNGLDDILRGEVWRLVTPIFLHFNLMHIVFDAWALLVLGTVIEYRRGTVTLAVLVLVSAIASDVGEYAFDVSFYGAPRVFGGMSGVVYALFGYLWMKGRVEPEQGLILHPKTVQTMLFWLVICFTGLLGPIANAAHVSGLVVGMLFGLARF